MVGGGTLQGVFSAAAAYWERAFSAPGDDWTVNVRYGWAPLTGINGQHLLLTQGGTPDRETGGEISLDDSGGTHLLADPTPFDNSEYQKYAAYSSDLGGRTIDTGRVYEAMSGASEDLPASSGSG